MEAALRDKDTLHSTTTCPCTKSTAGLSQVSGRQGDITFKAAMGGYRDILLKSRGKVEVSAVEEERDMEVRLGDIRENENPGDEK